MASTLLYLTIDFDGKGRSVAGESTAARYKNRIEVESFSWGLKSTHRDVEARKVNTTVKPDVIEIEKFYDKSSPTLARYMKENKRFKWAQLQYAWVVLGEDRQTQVLNLTLKDGYIETIKLSASGSGKAMAVKETVSLSFRWLEMQYNPPVIGTDNRGAAMTFNMEQPTVDAAG
jgi:type VI secretion system Hcp family effector